MARESAEVAGARRAVAVSLGDPRGIGPEVSRAAAETVLADDPALALVTIGPEALDPKVGTHVSVGAWDGSERGAGLVAAEAIRVGVEMAMRGEVAALVTAPIHKVALRAAGIDFPGHTEMLQSLTESPAVGMLMVTEGSRLGPPLRVLLATTHIPLREVPDHLTTDLLVAQTTLLDDALRRHWRITGPRIGLCALNPHASDGGLFGDEEERLYGPALKTLTAAGIAVTGPLPADTVFLRALEGSLDAVVAPYHDVGMAAFKTVSFGRGVNVTLGLPFVRTSPDHGTALDIAGTGQADPSSMVEALSLAIQLAFS